MLTRRRMLALGGVVGGATILGALRDSPGHAECGHDMNMPGMSHMSSKCSPVRTVANASVIPFSVPMPVPPVLAPAASGAGMDAYRIAMRPADVEIIPGLRTPALTYGGAFVGPTIRARTGRRVMIAFDNGLGETANVHLHGGHVAPTSDGYPMDLIDPGRRRVYEYPNRQRATTLWYHDHTHHMEDSHVYRGLHGFYLLEDPEERHFGLPSGRYEVPIMLRDAQIDATGALVQEDPANRTVLIANGRAQPYFQVAARKYRLRLLNASIHRTFTLNLGGVVMTQIGSDGGLLPAPVRRTELVLSPGERADVVVDFARHPVGSRLVLADTIGPVLRLDVVRRAPDHSRVPDRLRPVATLPPATAVRDFALSLNPDTPIGYINGKIFDPDRVDARIRRGSTEIWRITNKDTDLGGRGVKVDHNFHIHLVQFRVLDRDGKPPLPGESGLKDTVLVRAGETVRVQATFGDYLGRYVFHCHMLEHSSIGMMGQYEIVR